MNCVLIGVPLDLGAENLGVAGGPETFRDHHIIDKLTHNGLTIHDRGNVSVHSRDSLEPGNPKLKYLNEIVEVSNTSAHAAEEAIRGGNKVIALGGDHSINLGVVSGASAALGGDLGLIYLDAHGDMNTDQTTLSGNIHGMHLASLMGFGTQELIDVHTPGTKINKDHLLHIGGSDFDQAEREFIMQQNLACFTLFDLLTHGFEPLLGLINELKQKVSNIWVSLDLDVIDMVDAPAAAMPNRGGMHYREVAALAEYIGQNCNVVGIDVVEYNPTQDTPDRKTAELGIELIAKFLGKNYSWYTNYMERNRV